MKSYTLPASVLLAVSGLLLLGIATSLKHAREAGAKLETDRIALDQARADLSALDSQARLATSKSAPANKFLDVWTPHLTPTGSIDEIFGRLDTLAVDNLLSPSGKSFATNTKYFFNGQKLTVQSVNITVAGDYSRTLNWLGAVESAYPLARVQQITYTANGTSLALATQLVFPQKFGTP